MENTNFDKILNRVENLAHDAQGCDCYAVKAHALGDIMFEIGKNLPKKFQIKMPRQRFGKIAKTPSTIVAENKLPTGRTVSMEIENEATDHVARAYLYDDKECVCCIQFFNRYQSKWWITKICFAAFHGLISKCLHSARYKRNKKAIRAKSLMPDGDTTAMVNEQRGMEEQARAFEENSMN